MWNSKQKYQSYVNYNFSLLKIVKLFKIHLVPTIISKQTLKLKGTVYAQTVFSKIVSDINHISLTRVHGV